MFSHWKKVVAFMGVVRIWLNFQHLSGKLRLQIIQRKKLEVNPYKVYGTSITITTYIICLNTAKVLSILCCLVVEKLVQSLAEDYTRIKQILSKTYTRWTVLINRKDLQRATLWTLKILSVSRAVRNMYIFADFFFLTKQTKATGYRKILRLY